MITTLENSNEVVAQQIHAVFQNSYIVEAEIIGVSDLPPLSRSRQDILNAKTDFYGFIHNTCVAAVVEVNSFPTKLEINSLTVDPKFFRQGIAGLLLQYILTSFDVELATVETAAQNAPAIKLYEKYGFRIIKKWTPSHGIEKVEMHVQLRLTE